MISHARSRGISRRVALTLGSVSVASAVLATGSSDVVAETGTAALDRNRELVQRLFRDGINTGDESVILALYAADATSTNTGTREPAAAGLPISLHRFLAAVPGVQATVDALVAEADLVAARITWRAMHPPAGTHLEGQTMHLFRINQDQIIEQWAAGWEWLNDRGV